MCSPRNQPFSFSKRIDIPVIDVLQLSSLDYPKIKIHSFQGIWLKHQYLTLGSCWWNHVQINTVLWCISAFQYLAIWECIFVAALLRMATSFSSSIYQIFLVLQSFLFLLLLYKRTQLLIEIVSCTTQEVFNWNVISSNTGNLRYLLDSIALIIH